MKVKPQSTVVLLDKGKQSVSVTWPNQPGKETYFVRVSRSDTSSPLKVTVSRPQRKK